MGQTGSAGPPGNVQTVPQYLCSNLPLILASRQLLRRDAFENLSEVYKSASDYYLRQTIPTVFADIQNLLSGQSRLVSSTVPPIYLVLDEAQNAVHLPDSWGFASSRDHTVPRPILQQVVKVLMTEIQVELIISGTALCAKDVQEACSSSGQPNVLVTCRQDNFMTCTAQKDYLLQYLPPQLAQSLSGEKLFERVHKLLRGRYRLTAIYAQELIHQEHGFEYPHHLLSLLVRHMTGYMPVDIPVDLEVPPSPGLLVIHTQVKLFNHQRFKDLGNDSDMVRFIYAYVCYWLLDHPFVDHPPPTLSGTALACFLGGDFGRVDEPLALLSLRRFLEERSILYFASHLADRMRDKAGRWQAFEDTIALYLGYALASGLRLDLIFDFAGNKPSWASDTGHLVACVKGATADSESTFVPFPAQDDIPHPQLALRSGSMAATQSWFDDPGGRAFLFPDSNFGPDCVALVRLESGKLAFFLLQMKNYEGTWLRGDVLQDGIRKSSPMNFWRSKSVSKKKSTVTKDVNSEAARANIWSAMQQLSGESEIQVLRVLAAFPAIAKNEAAAALQNADQQGPIALLNIDTLMGGDPSRFLDALVEKSA
ncbi:hypothetical protein EIP91_010518 [Steccherinum ochraceum]|uniref:Uncharacterized protein n=1 Tax=Steccherinum ochraceum TaxID=92696 RepID=A0A4R0R2Q7_9APHY|nr:hypothetical protein EIP91_010518 [Steccherinum ochraceum]